MSILKKSRTLLIFSLLSVLMLGQVRAEVLTSENFQLNDVSINSAGDVLQSSAFSMLTDAQETSSDVRLTSGSYALLGGLPNGTLANTPSVRCFETNTDNTTSNCTNLPNDFGMIAECGTGGCFDRAKLEISTAGNPLDTLYIVKAVDLTDNVEYYLQSDHTLALTYDIADFMTLCELEGYNPDDPACDAFGDTGWNESLQRHNVLGLKPANPYAVTVSALNGDFSQTAFSSSYEATTTNPSLTFDIDIAPSTGAATESNAPYTVAIGQIPVAVPTTATNYIWFDLGTNAPSGFNLYIKSAHNGLYSTSKNATIPSENEDLATDNNDNGGFGLKFHNYTPSQFALGPLQKSSQYNTAGANEVGAVSTDNTLILFTDDLNGNLGQLTAGRAALTVKARSRVSSQIPISGDYSTTLTAIIVGNY